MRLRLGLMYWLMGNVVWVLPAFVRFDDSTYLRLILCAVGLFGNAMFWVLAEVTAKSGKEE